MSEFGSAIKVGLGIVAVIGVVSVGAIWMNAGVTVATAPAAIVSKTFDPNNVIHNYEWFHDTNGAFKARVNQVKAHRQLVQSEPAGKERSRLSIELAGMQQSCRELAERYNANAQKTNRSIFMGREAPESLNPNLCEG